MNNLKLLPFLLLFFLVSCSSDDSNDNRGSYARLNLEVKFNNSSIVVSSDGEVTDKVVRDIRNFPNFVYVVHNADNGNFLFYKILDAKELEIVVTESSTSTVISEKLPFGNYYVSLVAAYETKMKAEFLKAISQEYTKAACQMPNSHMFYATTEVDCTPPHEVYPELYIGSIDVDEQLQLKQITSTFTFLLPKGSKGIPEKANFSIAVEAKNIPNSFYLKDGQALGNSDMTGAGLTKTNYNFEVKKRFEHQLLATYYTLSNYTLEDTEEERGTFSVVYKEDVASDVITNQTKMKMGENRIEGIYGGSSHTCMWPLYSSKAPEQVETDCLVR